MFQHQCISCFDFIRGMLCVLGMLVLHYYISISKYRSGILEESFSTNLSSKTQGESYMFLVKTKFLSSF